MTSFAEIRAKFAARRANLKDPNASAAVLHRLLRQVRDVKQKEEHTEEQKKRLLLIDVPEQVW